MTVDAEILEMMPDTVGLQRFKEINRHSERVYADEILLIRARVEGRVKRVIDAKSGEERVSMVQVYLSEAPGATPEDRLILPVRYDPVSPPIIAVDSQTDEVGPLYEVLYA